MAELPPIENLNQGGIADSDYVGAANSVAEMVNCDIHSESGVIKCNQALTLDHTPAAAVNDAVACSNGSTYEFLADGKVIEREANGTVTVRATAAPSAGSAAILSAEEYQGHIYYAMESRLGRFAVPAAGAAVSLSSNYATFGVTDATFHPMLVLNLVLYIGDGNQVAQVDAGTFSANALDITTPLRVSSLGFIDTDLLIGTFVNTNVMKTQVVRWNTWSVSFSVSDPIPEVGVNAFLDSDNIVLVNAGTKGNIYLYDGAQLSQYKKVKGDFTLANKAKVLGNAVYNFNSMPLFGMSQENGDGVNLGIYSIARTNRNYPYVLNLEYSISTGNLTGIKITTIVPISADQFLVAWQDDNGSTTYGVDILSLTVKATAHYTTRVLSVRRHDADVYGFVHVPYRSLPDNADIKVFPNVDYAGFATEKDTLKDAERHKKYTDKQIGDAHALQIKTQLIPESGTNNAPEVEKTIIQIQN